MKTLKAKIPVCKAGGGFVHNKRVRFYFQERKMGFTWRSKGEEMKIHNA
jgi:hypothetical protein